MVKCIYCRDKGKVPKCQKCGKELVEAKSSVLANELTIEEYSKLYIPDFYKGNLFNKTILTNSYPSLATNKSFVRYAEQLDKLHDIFLQGRVPTKSAIIHSTVRKAKHILAYSCLQLAKKQGLSIFPLLDTMQLRRLMYTNTNNMYTKDYTTPDDFKFSLEELATADVVFISVEHDVSKGTAHETITQIMDMRSRYNKPTFVLTEYSVNDITRTDFKRQFEHRFNRTGQEDPYRYPILISMTEVE